MSSNPPEIMTIGETAQYLRISQSSLYKLAQEGRIPCQKVGRHWRFHRGMLQRWMAGQTKIDFQVTDTGSLDFIGPTSRSK